MNNIWLKKYEESVTDIRKEKAIGNFLVNPSNILIMIRNVLHYLTLFLPIKTRILYLFLQLFLLQVVNGAKYHMTI